MEHDDEIKVIARVLEGDREAYAFLVKKYQTPIYHLAYRMTGNVEDAADLTQDIFIRAYVKLWRYHPQKKFFTWLYAIAVNTIKNHLKRKYHQEMQLLDMDRLSRTETEERYERDIWNKLAKLDIETRAMIVMRYQQELSFAEMSEITGKSLSAVKMKIYRGLEQLKIMLEKK